MDLQQQTQTIEDELLDVIIKDLENHSLDTDTARKLAGDFLNILPVTNRSELLDRLNKLGTHYPEAKFVYTLEFSKDQHEKESQALDQMHAAIKAGNIEHAINVAKVLHQ